MGSFVPAVPDPLENVPATGKLIEHGGGYWQWDGQEWKPVPRAIPVARKLNRAKTGKI